MFVFSLMVFFGGIRTVWIMAPQDVPSLSVILSIQYTLLNSELIFL